MAHRPPSTFKTTVSYPNRQSHEDALDKTDAVGPHGGVGHAALVLPLRKLPEELAAYLSLRFFGSTKPAALWSKMDMSTARVDGRAPHRAEIHEADVACLPNGWVLIGPDPTEQKNGTFAWLLSLDKANRATERPLVGSKSERVRIFDSREHARQVLTPSVLAMGSPPPGLRWSGDPGLPSEWEAGAAGTNKATYRGQNGPWSIEWSPYSFTVICNRIRHRKPFDNLAEARRFIITEDAR